MRNLYIILSVIIAALSAMTSCHREEIPCDDSSVKDGMPIEFSRVSVTIDTKTETEPAAPSAPINDFKVWASLTSNNNTQYGIFGEIGTIVSKSINGQSLSWLYSPLRYWRPGSYKFYAVSPVSHADGGLSSTGLNLTFENGWNLSTDPVDLLLATSDVSNDVVSLEFDHLLSKISFSAKNISETPITITSVKISGNHKVATSMSYLTQNTWGWESDDTSDQQTLSLRETPTGSITLTNSYIPLTQDSGVLVFPESCDLEVELTINHGISPGYTKTKTILNTGWQAGKHYQYNIKVSPEYIEIGQVTVTPWNTKDGTGNDLVVDGEIEF
jgi:hypothetical protein